MSEEKKIENKNITLDNASDKANEFKDQAKAKIDEVLNSQKAQELKGKAEDLAEEAKEKLVEALNSDTAQNLKHQAEELGEKAEEVLGDVGEKVGEYADLAEEKLKGFVESEEVQTALKKGKDFLNDLFGSDNKETHKEK